MGWLRMPNFGRLPRPQWPQVKRAAGATAWLLGLAAIGAGWWHGVPRLEAYAEQMHRPEAISIEFLDAPAWVNRDLENRLTASAEVAVRSGSPLDRDELADIRAALLNTGWFETIEQVRRVTAEFIEVDGTFVRPFAVIRHGGHDYLVDPQGVRLPKRYPAGQATQFIAVIGPRFDPPNRAGLQWGGSDISAALRLIELIGQQSWRDQVAAVDITGQVSGAPIRLITDRGSRIVWGSPPGEEGGLEALVERKLHNLNYQYRNFDHIDMGHDGEVDITSHDVVVKR